MVLKIISSIYLIFFFAIIVLIILGDIMKNAGIKDIRDYLAFHGLKNFEAYRLDDDMLKTIQEIVAFDIPEFKEVTVPYVTKQHIIKVAKAFFATKVLVHDVGFMSDKMLIDAIRKNKIVSFAQLVEVYNQTGVYVSPYEIPVDLEKNSIFYGSLDLQIVLIENREILRKMLIKIKPFFNRLVLPMLPTELSIPTYVHEIMHSQLESHKGIIDDYYDAEVFSIFFELLSAYECNIHYLITLTYRLNVMFNDFNNMYYYQAGERDRLPDGFTYYDFCSAGKYLLSTLKAFYLLDKYFKASNLGKKEILQQMQAVMDGVVKTSEFLKHYDVSYESILDSSISDRLLRM